MKCNTCKENSLYDDVECFFCHQGVNKELAVFGGVLMRALNKPLPKKDKKEKKDSNIKLYSCSIEQTGYTTPRELAIAIGEGKLNDIKFEDKINAIGIIKGESFKEEKPFTYTVKDSIDIRSVLAHYSIIQVTRAIINASKDEFFSSKGLSYNALRNNISRLLISKKDKKENKESLKDSIIKAIDKLSKSNPFEADDFASIDRSYMTESELESLLSEINKVIGECNG
jgi:hypothetical protein